MKVAVIVFTLFVGLSFNFASDTKPEVEIKTNLFYTQGMVRGEEVKTTAYLAYYDICYKGIASQAEGSLKKLLHKANNNLELINAFVRADNKHSYMVYGFTDYQCLENGLSSAEMCREIKIASPCRN